MPEAAVNVADETTETVTPMAAALKYTLYEPDVSVAPTPVATIVCVPEVWMPMNAMLVPALVSVLPACTLMVDVPVVNAHR